MKKLKLELSDESIKISDLNIFINEFDLRLPESYIDFILKNNGGYPNLTAYGNPYDDGLIVDSFYSVSLSDYRFNKDEVALLSSREIIRTHQIIEKNIPPYLYPFADDEGGAKFCLSMKDESFGKVFLVYLDGTYDEPTFISDSFSKFIETLEDVEKYENDF
ncbi:SMI1/KNR4 family protein [Tenacibaculum aiptasiae]|uniref:SMI1/KNR4 family protein n=1 Tax=Tenacibaculum aiptasiae TaxID=426481 RepID=A0A7J5ARU1_9FLAO|nr:SMI1/KNR4 family protein [Tenacibaculum aiptasiae]KAB1160356.1 SMI1/KNR4 family protein [Tenacibaculum aiptasiae]